MAIEAFVVPYLGRSAGVVFWEPTRASGRSAGTRRTAGAEPIEVYAPGPLSPGEAAELQSAFVASLGRAFAPRRRSGLFAWWWIAGLAAAVLLAVGAASAGPGYAWIAFAGALTALPLGLRATEVGLSRREALRARRLARHVSDLAVVPGTDQRQQERVAALWRVGKRSGAPARQLADLEAQCRELAWPAVAAFYGQRRQQFEQPETPEGGGMARRGRLKLPFGRRAAVPAHAVVEMRAW
jgi:hypothetical protein